MLAAWLANVTRLPSRPLTAESTEPGGLFYVGIFKPQQHFLLCTYVRQNWQIKTD